MHQFPVVQVPNQRVEFRFRYLYEYFKIALRALKCFYNIGSQILFFMLCQMVLNKKELFMEDPYYMPPEESTWILAVTSVLYYTILNYVCEKMINILTWDFTPNYTIRSIVKIIVLLYITCLQCTFLPKCFREQGIYYKPEWDAYTMISLLYYICTENIFHESFTKIMEYLDFHIFDNLEYLILPCILNSLSVFVAAHVIAYSLVTYSKNYSFIIFIFFLTVYMRCIIIASYLDVIKFEKDKYQNFREATEEQIRAHDDVCAICLQDMSHAKITPCNHLFHGLCLKQCMRISKLCPLCKRYLNLTTQPNFEPPPHVILV